jgi:hypothetical protein
MVAKKINKNGVEINTGPVDRSSASPQESPLERRVTVVRKTRRWKKRACAALISGTAG